MNPRNINLKYFFKISAFAAFIQSCQINDTIAPHQNTAPAPVSVPVPVSALPTCGTHVLWGYTDKTSYLPGEEMEVFLEADSSRHCGLNFYKTDGTLAFSANASIFPQTIGSIDPWQNGYGFSNTKVKIPSNLKSGVYFIENKISFVVKSLLSADVTVVYPINTINAYTNSGGKNLYVGSSYLDRANIVSFLRPMNSYTEQGECKDCLSWFPSLSTITVRYISDLDLDDYTSLDQSKIVIIVGHSEYWTRKARRNFDQFVYFGGHAIILSGNTMWWQVRYTNYLDGLICYKDAQLDPEPDATLKTITWDNSSLQYSILSSIGVDFNHGGYGLKSDLGWDGFKISSPASPLLEGTGLRKGDILHLPSGECDGAPIKGFDSEGYPILDNDQLQFEKLELIGFDRGSRGGSETFPTFIVMKKTKTSGIIVNTASIAWCSSSGIGSSGSGQKIKLITQNAIHKLLTGANVFSY